MLEQGAHSWARQFVSKCPYKAALMTLMDSNDSNDSVNEMILMILTKS